MSFSLTHSEQVSATLHQLTFRHGRFQALMGSQGWVGESIAVDDGGVLGNRILGHSRQFRVGVIDIEKAKSLRKASGPFKVVHQWPCCVTTDIHII